MRATSHDKRVALQDQHGQLLAPPYNADRAEGPPSNRQIASPGGRHEIKQHKETCCRCAANPTALNPHIRDLQLDLGGAFSTFVNAALNYTLNPPFDPYADDLSFLLGAFIFEDVAVSWVQVRG